MPAVFGEPESCPDDESVSPFGNAPLVAAKLYGAVPPLAVIVWLYAVPVVPFGRVLGETVIVGHVIVTV